MPIFYVFSFFFVLLISIEMWAFGKWMSKQNHLFESYPLNSFLLGAVMWFTITFLVIFPFVWLELEILYFVIVFFVKEVVSWFFIMARKDDWFIVEGSKDLLIIFIGGVLLTLFNHYVLSIYTNPNFIEKKHTFQTWIILIEVIGDVANVSNNLVLAWPLAFLTGIISYATVMSFVNMLSKSITLFEPVFGFSLISLFILLLSHKIDFASSLAVWFSIVAFYFATQVILKSRRRFAVFFSMSFLSSWSINPDVFFAYAALAIVTTIVYTFLRKSKVYLFWVQLVAPIAVVGSLYVYEASPVGAVFMVLGTVVLYVFMLTYVKTQVHAKINKWFIKTRIVLPLIIITVSTTVGIVFIGRDQPTINDLFIFQHSIFDNFYGGKAWSIIGIFFSSIICILLAIYQWYWKVKGKKMIEHRIIILLATSLILFAYNPFIEISFISSLNIAGFEVLRNMIIIPIVISLANKAKLNTWTKYINQNIETSMY